MDDPLAGKIIANYWSRPSLLQQSDDDIHLLEANSIYYGTNDGPGSMTVYSPTQDYMLPVCKPFGIELFNHKMLHHEAHGHLAVGHFVSPADWSIHEWSLFAQSRLTALLANMPRMQSDDVQQRIELLLGPPTVESLRFMVEVGVYFSSNNIMSEYGFIEWMFRTVPWTVLKFIFSTSNATIRAFAEFVLRVATSTKTVEILRELLKIPHLQN